MGEVLVGQPLWRRKAFGRNKEKSFGYNMNFLKTDGQPKKVKNI